MSAYQALYRKYRPQTFDDVVGQRSITETLKTRPKIPTISPASAIPSKYPILIRETTAKTTASTPSTAPGHGTQQHKTESIAAISEASDHMRLFFFPSITDL